MPELWWCYPLLGAAAGLLAGLLGVGGGLVIVAALAWLLPLQDVPVAATMHVALATSLASIVATAVASGTAHHRRDAVLWRSVAWLVPGMLLGGWLGARVAGGLDGGMLRAGVAMFCVLAAWQLWRSGSSAANRSVINQVAAARVAPSGPLLTAVAIVIGAVSALVGIGGGSLTVPLLIARGARAVHAVGSSSVCGFFIAIASATGYASLVPPTPLGTSYLGYVFWPGALLLAAASVLTAPLGARIAHRMQGHHLQRLFAAFLVLMAVLTWFAPHNPAHEESAVASIEHRAGSRISTASGR